MTLTWNVDYQSIVPWLTLATIMKEMSNSSVSSLLHLWAAPIRRLCSVPPPPTTLTLKHSTWEYRNPPRCYVHVHRLLHPSSNLPCWYYMHVWRRTFESREEYWQITSSISWEKIFFNLYSSVVGNKTQWICLLDSDYMLKNSIKSIIIRSCILIVQRNGSCCTNWYIHCDTPHVMNSCLNMQLFLLD